MPMTKETQRNQLESAHIFVSGLPIMQAKSAASRLMRDNLEAAYSDALDAFNAARSHKQRNEALGAYFTYAGSIILGPQS